MINRLSLKANFTFFKETGFHLDIHIDESRWFFPHILLHVQDTETHYSNIEKEHYDF